MFSTHGKQEQLHCADGVCGGVGKKSSVRFRPYHYIRRLHGATIHAPPPLPPSSTVSYAWRWAAIHSTGSLHNGNTSEIIKLFSYYGFVGKYQVVIVGCGNIKYVIWRDEDCWKLTWSLVCVLGKGEISITGCTGAERTREHERWKSRDDSCGNSGLYLPLHT